METENKSKVKEKSREKGTQLEQESKFRSKKHLSEKNTENPNQKIALILVRGLADMPQPIKDTLTLLKLRRKNHAVIIPKNKVNLGMIFKVNDYVTWGEIDETTFKELVSKRGEEDFNRATDRKNLYQYKSVNFNGKRYKSYFRLNPPAKGFGRKGIKVSFRAGGALGYRGEKINDLVKRML